MTSISREMREERMKRVFSENEIISDRMYNLTMGAVVLYGLLVNVLLCRFGTSWVDSLSPIVFLIAYVVCAGAGIAITFKSQNPALSFLGYNLVVLPLGLVIAREVEYYGGIDSGVVLQAFIHTLGIVIIMVAASVAFPAFFEKLGSLLMISLGAIIVVELICMIAGIGFNSNVIPTISAALFSFYIGYDFWRSQQFCKTVDNAVDCALDIYLDIANLFLNLLRIFGNSKNKD